MLYTVKSLFVAAATIGFDEIFRQNLLSKNCFLLRPLFKGGYYLRAATISKILLCGAATIQGRLVFKGGH